MNSPVCLHTHPGEFVANNFFFFFFCCNSFGCNSPKTSPQVSRVDVLPGRDSLPRFTRDLRARWNAAAATAKANGRKSAGGWRDWLSNGASWTGHGHRTAGHAGGGRDKELRPREQHPSCLKCCEIRWLGVGRRVSHRSPASALPSPTPPVHAGETGRQSGRPAISADEKQQNQRDKLHPPANVWANVTAGQRGNSSFISTAAVLISVKGDVQQDGRLMCPAGMDSSRGRANPFICCCSSYLPHGEPAPLRPARIPPRGEVRISLAKPFATAQTANRSAVWTEGSPSPREDNNPDRAEQRPNLTRNGERGSAKL